MSEKSRAILKIDPASGTRTLVSFASQGSGTPFTDVRGVTFEASGQVVAVNDDTADAVIRVHPSAGNRSVLSGMTVGLGPALMFPKQFA